MGSSLDPSGPGETGAGLKLNAESGAFGDISTTAGGEEPGFGSTTNQTETVEKSDPFIDRLYSVGDPAPITYSFLIPLLFWINL
jgi:hypothetical protein